MENNTKLFIKDLTQVLVAALVLAGLTRFFIFLPFKVQGSSMEDNFHPEDYLIVDRISSRFNDYQRGGVIVFRHQNSKAFFIKRIIGLPGDVTEIRQGRVYINGQFLNESAYLSSEQSLTPGEVSITLGKNQYFVMGDNRRASYDSRTWGALDENNIIGQVFIRLFPFGDFKKF